MVRRSATHGLEPFCLHMYPDYHPWPHTKLLCEHLEAVNSGEINKLAIMMPPRTGKTFHMSEFLPAYFLGCHPTESVVLASYTANRAETSSRVVRAMISDGYRWPFASRMSADSTSVKRWHTTLGGTLRAVGVGGSLTGFGAHLLVIDDPLKGRAEADSEVYRSRCWDWYSEVAQTRLMLGGRQIIGMTRWHEDDLLGHLLNSKGANEWTVLRIPWFAEESDMLGRPLGQPLDMEIKPPPSVDKGEISSRGFEAEYQQRPTPLEGALFRAAWFKSFDEHVDKVVLLTGGQPIVVAQHDLQRFCTVDLAASVKTSADFFAIGCWSLTPSNQLLLHRMIRKRVEGPDQLELIRTVAAEHRASTIGIESVGYQLTMIQQAQRAGLPVKALKADKDKVSRAMTIAARYESGQVYHLRGAGWRGEFEQEMLVFPSGRHDDQVDVAAYAGLMQRAYAYAEAL